MTEIKKRYSIGEEIANAITHGIGTLLSIVALVLLVVKANKYAPEHLKGTYITAYTIFGASLIWLYLASTLYHSLPQVTKKVFGIIDHCSIYILIAGSYTAYCLTILHGKIGWWIFGIIWGLAVLGIVFYSIFEKKVRILSMVLYILMGWLIILATQHLKEAMTEISFLFLILGGITYTVGCIFYSMKKIKWTHSVWHLFVLGGSICHFFSVWFTI